MIGAGHSWSHTVEEILFSLISFGHDLSVFSSHKYPDGFLSSFYKKNISPVHIDFNYTLPIQWKVRYHPFSKVKATIFNYESSIMSEKWKSLTSIPDLIFPSSNYCKNIFLNNGWPEHKIKVLPLGFNQENFKTKDIFIERNERYRFLCIAINHYRKNIDLLLKSYFNCFSDDDPVELIIKTITDAPKIKFEYSVPKMIEKVKSSFNKKLPKLTVIGNRIDNIATLYNSCDAFVSATSSEGFGLPFLEAMAAKKIVIAPRATGQLDFLNDNNSFLIDGKEVIAPDVYQYWEAHKEAKIFMPDQDSIEEKLKLVFNSKPQVPIYNIEQYTWDNVAKNMISLCGY